MFGKYSTYNNNFKKRKSIRRQNNSIFWNKNTSNTFPQINESAYEQPESMKDKEMRVKMIYKEMMLKNVSVNCLLGFPVFFMLADGEVYFGLESWKKLEVTMMKLAREKERMLSNSPHDSQKQSYGCNMASNGDQTRFWINTKEMALQLRSFIFLNFIETSLFEKIIQNDFDGAREIGRPLTKEERMFIINCVQEYFRITNIVESATAIRGPFGFSDYQLTKQDTFYAEFMNVTQFFPVASIDDIRKCLGNYRTISLPLFTRDNMILKPRTSGICENNINMDLITGPELISIDEGLNEDNV